RGSFDEQTVYDADPLEAARRWVQAGARGLHVVDLDGARQGRPVNLDHVARIAREVSVPVQVGGGLRTIDAVREARRAGASRMVLGTAAYRDLDLLDEALAELGNRVVVSVDARHGKPAAAGWTEELEIPVVAMIRQLGDRGVRRFVYSSIDRDGMLGGPDLEAAGIVAAAVRGSFMYSGGIASLEDLRALRALRQVNLAGVIVGKALYERRFGVEEGQQALEELL
ncbi:MAG TPA: 1-(5-phosphoribosyl)-5-[(5-phosphoribosylamino)methylideneamino] imidazole-4-carboxamide isomerase, partial [Candidatus Limnocylindria bacterium]|nr:1-(5-phosphoribosyl)-5-[(5-phosphoribosylamino)methylideneamino] imidazole-4-carboxamide isomerase [Candidatus Limnocylindria bacterium]